MRILLVLPAGERGKAAAGNGRATAADLRDSLLHLNVLAAVTPWEHEVAFRDETVEPVDVDVEADVVGLCFAAEQARRACQLAQEFRSRGRTVIAAGRHPTACADRLAGTFDAVVAGWPEGPWLRALEDLQRGRLRAVYRDERCQSRPEAAADKPVAAAPACKPEPVRLADAVVGLAVVATCLGAFLATVLYLRNGSWWDTMWPLLRVESLARSGCPLG